MAGESAQLIQADLQIESLINGAKSFQRCVICVPNIFARNSGQFYREETLII